MHPQAWGWALAIAIPNPEGRNITLNGSSDISGSLESEFTVAFVTATNSECLTAQVVFNDINL
jgi:hypothetical protein